MNRRDALKVLAITGVSAFYGARAQTSSGGPISLLPNAQGQYELAPLGYAYDALEPHIDTQTMQLHHQRHHGAAVTNLNTALQKYPEVARRPLFDLLGNLEAVPEDIRTAVRNNGGSHFNHTFFWDLMTPGGAKAPAGALQAAVQSAFGGLEGLQTRMNEVGAARFGSGWAWLVVRAGRLEAISLPNQDPPLMEGLWPVLGVDVWEHAYYLKYQNRRADYLKAWWSTVNWDRAAVNFERARRA